MSEHTRQKGQILVEFILIAPVLLAIAGGAIEIARFLRFNQVASVFSQEAAMTAYRRCSDSFVFRTTGEFDQTTSQAEINACLRELQTGLQQRLSDAYPDTTPTNPRFSVLLSVYRRDQAAGAGIGFTNLTRMVFPNSAQDPDALSSQYNSSSNTIVKVSTNTVVFTEPEIRSMERVTIAEVAYIYSPAIPIYRLLMGDIDLMKTDERFRETTIL